jgi:hypothetical protein
MITESLIAKIIGVISGACLALIFIPPRSISGFIRRSTAAVVAGMTLGTPTRLYLGWEADAESVIAAFCIAAFCSWWGMGLAKRILESYKKELD